MPDDLKISELEEITEPEVGDILPLVTAPGSSPADKKITLENLKIAMNLWPIGAIFMAVISTNPATLLGFGVWAIFSQGRVLAGYDQGDKDFAWCGAAVSGDGLQLYVVANDGRLNFSYPIGLGWYEARPAGDVTTGWYCVATDSDGSDGLAARYGYRLYIVSSSGWYVYETKPAGDVSKDWRRVDVDSDASVMFACVANGRLYLSVNHGTAWNEMKPAGEADMAWYDLCCDSDGSVLIACIDTGRIWMSVDTGANWAEIRPLGDVDATWYDVACSANGSVILAVPSHGRVWMSIDTGANWAEIRPKGDVDAYWQLVECNSDASVIVCAEYNGRAYISTDSGANWDETRPAGDTDFYWSALSMSSTGGVILLGAWGGRMWKSTDLGVSWVEQRAGIDKDFIQDEHTAGAKNVASSAQTFAGNALATHQHDPISAGTPAGTINWPANVPTMSGITATFSGTQSTVIVNHKHTMSTGTGSTGNFAQVIGTVDNSSGGTGATPTQTALDTQSGNPISGGAASYTPAGGVTITSQGAIAWPANPPTFAGDALATHQHAAITAGTPAGTNTPGAATSVLQPYIVVYMWKRTA